MENTSKYFYAGDEAAFLDFIKQQKYTSIYVLSDENVYSKCTAILKEYIKNIWFSFIVVSSGEDNKNLSTLQEIWTQLENADRHALLINFGGGLIGDMGGMAASLHKRGIDFMHIPTTLLAMADATTGGKTGVNFHDIKNHLGLFSNPKAVYINPRFLETLSQEELLAGMAEIVKLGIIYKPDLLSQYEKWEDGSIPDLNLIRSALEAKLEIVEIDPIERGIRKLLNFGHTIGHALESASMSLDTSLLHGQAVAYGMLGESFMAHNRGMLSQDDFEKIQAWVLPLLPDYDLNLLDMNLMVKYLKADKKNYAANISFSLPLAIGEGSYDNYFETKEIQAAIRFLLKL
jgi:3-dehydroquinate synthase